MTAVRYGSIKSYTKKYSFCYYLNRSFVQQDRRFCKILTLVTEAHADCFACGEFETIFRDQILYAVYTQLRKSVCICGRNFARIQRAKSSTNNDASKPFKTDLTILLILRLKRIGDNMLPRGIPIS